MSTWFAVTTIATMDASLLAFSGYPPLRDVVSSVALTFFAFLGFGVWAHHMFAVGMGPIPDTVFSLTTMLIAIPTLAVSLTAPVGSSIVSAIASINLVAMSSETFRETMDINVHGTFLACREAMRIMQHQRRGSIVTLSSASGLDGGGQHRELGTVGEGPQSHGEVAPEWI